MGMTMCYSESFKLQVVREYEEGKFSSLSEASRLYDIKGSGTLRKWIIKYGKNHLLNKVVKVETPKERNEIKELKAKIRTLESALSTAHIGLVVEKEYLKLACELAGVKDVEEFKKKHNIL